MKKGKYKRAKPMGRAGEQLPDSSHEAIRRELRKALSNPIEIAMEEEGITPARLAKKLRDKLDAKEVKATYDAKRGGYVESGEMEAHGPQLQALDMAFKLKGAYAPEVHDMDIRPVDRDPAEIKMLKDIAKDFTAKLRGK